MLTDWDAPYIRSLVKLIETQSKSTLANWAVDYSERVLLPLWNKHYPDDPRPQNALKAAREWLSGKIKLQEARKAILQCHAAAREAENNHVARSAARAIGQSASTVHSARHCIGLALYGALAVACDALGSRPGNGWSGGPPKNANVCLPCCAKCRLKTRRTLRKSTGSVE
jgi:hypothetical protein